MKEIKELIKEKYFGKLNYLSCEPVFEEDYEENEDFETVVVATNRFSHNHLYFSYINKKEI